MNRKKLFFGVTTLMIAVSAIVATKANTPAPDYYINNAGQCVEAPLSLCEPGEPTCFSVIPGQGSTAKAIFDLRTTSNVCQQQLEAVN